MNEEELIKHCQREVEIAERIKRYDKHYLEHELVLKIINENKQLKADYGNKAQVERDILLQEKQELIDYLKVEQLFYYNRYKCSKKLEDLKKYNYLINEYDKILSKIEKSDK